jgi:hypothetical protein
MNFAGQIKEIAQQFLLCPQLIRNEVRWGRFANPAYEAGNHAGFAHL